MAVRKDCVIFAAVKRKSVINSKMIRGTMNNRQGIMSNRHGAMPRQKGMNFSVILVPDYLVVPNNLLTHNADVSKPRFFLRARVEQNNLLPASRQAAGSNALCPFANSKSINIFTKRAPFSSLYLTHFRSHWSGTESGAFN